MSHKAGSSALSRPPISFATALTRSTVARSSVSGIVKNCGACGSIAPPITLDCTRYLLSRGRIAATSRRTIVPYPDHEPLEILSARGLREDRAASGEQLPG